MLLCNKVSPEIRFFRFEHETLWEIPVVFGGSFMIDLHCHIIPGIDDGAKSAEIACAMAENAWNTGVDTIVATPHCNLNMARPNYRGWDYALAFSMFKALLKQRGIPITILPGAEVYGRSHNIRQLIEENRLVTLNHSRYLLVEFNFGADGEYISRILDAVSHRGLIPVVAHPERYEAVQQDPGLAQYWFSRGYIIQLNKGSILGLLGEGAQICSRELLARGFAHVIASDAHDNHYRPTGFRELLGYLGPYVDHRYLKLLLSTNPKRIISNQLIPSPGLEYLHSEEESS